MSWRPTWVRTHCESRPSAWRESPGSISTNRKSSPPRPSRGSDEALPGEGLTTREREILGHLVAGRTNTEIAATLVISPKTVSVHVSNILRKTGSRSRAEAAAKALRPT